jgi:2'-5' RNA ligase
MEPPVPGDSGLGLFVPAEANAAVNRWRRVYDPHYKTIVPHITVAYPPFVPETEWPLVRPALADCLQDFPSFTITLRELGTFAGDHPVLWLRPEDDGSLLRLRAALEVRLPDYVPPVPFDRYIPHVAVGFFASPAALSDARAAIQREMALLRFRADELIYMVFDDDGIWRLRDRLPLGSR